MKKEKIANDSDFFARNVSSPELLSALRFYEEARAAKYKAIKTEHARELILRKLEQYAPGDIAGQILILERSIENSWTGVFPLPAEYIKQRKAEAAAAAGMGASFDTDEFFAKALKKSYEKMRAEAREILGEDENDEQ